MRIMKYYLLFKHMCLNPGQKCGHSGVDTGKSFTGTFVAVRDQSDQDVIVRGSSRQTLENHIYIIQIKFF